MELTKELLEKRIQVLTVRKEQTIARVNALEGGLITLRGLLSDLDREETNETGEQVKEEPVPPVEVHNAVSP